MKTKNWMLMGAAALLLCACTAQAPKAEVGVKTDALENAAWDASEWISAVDAPIAIDNDDDLAPDGASWFVSTVQNKGKVVSAKWMTAGLGVYEIYLNGVPVGEEFLKPGFTHYLKTKRSFTYDLTDAFLKKAGAENQLAAQVTPGWWADKIVSPGGVGNAGKKCAFRGVLELCYADGSKELLGTDTQSWKAGIAGPVTHAAIFDGEAYDARIPMGFATPEKLAAPEVNTEFSGEILPSEGAEIYLRKDLALAPVEIYVWEGVEGAVEAEDEDQVQYGTVAVKRRYTDGETITLSPGETLVVDFGQNAAAVPAFRFKAAEGVHLTCLPGELLNDGNGAESRGMDGPEGSVHRRNLRVEPSCVRLDYIFAQNPDFADFYPCRTFFGYRFISVTADGPVEIASVRSLPVTSIAKDLETGTLTTGSELVNRLISNTIWGQRSNYLSVPTDCPQRNERLGWTADTQVFTETGSFFANTNRFFHKWMRDMLDSRNEFGAFPGVAPTAQYGGEFMRLGWSDAGIIVPWTIFKQFGDKEIVEENWDAMLKFMNHIDDTRYQNDAILSENGNYQWADWLSYEALESCSGKAFKDAATRADAVKYWNYLGASYWLIDASMMRDMAVATGRDSAPFEAMMGRARACLQEFLLPNGSFRLDVLNTMQTPALFALKNGLVEGAAKENMIARLKENFAAHGNCLQTGFLGTSILMQTLTDNGMADIAWELLFQRKNPSWLYSVDNGATTIWERWNSYTKESGMGPSGMNSFNHYAYGCVCQWIWETAAGISADPANPGFRHIVMKPVPDQRLGHLDAVFASAAGTVESHWKYEGSTWTWTFKVPEGATATVTLPGEAESKDYAAGTWTLTKNL